MRSSEQQLFLRALIESQDALAPQLMQRIEPQAQDRRARACADASGRPCGLVRRERVVQAVLDALRRDRRGRIDAQPAASVDPDLVPGMRIALAHDPVVGVAIVTYRLDSR